MAAQAESKPRRDLSKALASLVNRLQAEADTRVSKRRVTEKRWLLDIRQYYGEYDEKTAGELKNTPNKSSLFINATRPKTNACEAKIADMLFPTDDRNWGISPTPVPQLSANANKAMQMAAKFVDQANAAQDQGDDQHVALATHAQFHAAVAAKLHAELEEAKTRAQAMQDEMETQLTDCGYQAACREMLMDAAKIGTGVMKGPVANEAQARRAWEMQSDGVYRLGSCCPKVQPAFYRVDPWGFFPDPDVVHSRDSVDNFERHLYTASNLRSLAKQPGFDRDAIRRLIKRGPMGQLPTYLADLRAITGENLPPQDPRFQVWEYRGTVTAEEMVDAAEALGQEKMAEGAGAYEADPLDEMQIVLWFCQDEVLKFGIGHMDSGEPIYSVYNLEKDEASVWGFGIPFWMRDTQKALCAAWRMLMDNAGLSTGPQIEIDPSVVEPVDGVWSLSARKLWRRRENAKVGAVGIHCTDIPSHIQELLLIIKQCEMFMEEESAVTPNVMGDMGTSIQTARGTAMLANAANVTFRRMIKNFDDDMTTPNIRRLYDWNMQFSDKEYIKGDMQVDARGTSVLLVRELQSQNLTTLLAMLPPGAVAKWIGTRGPSLLRKTVQSMLLPADEVVETDDEIKQAAAAAAAQPPQPSPEQLKAQTAEHVATISGQSREAVANIAGQTKLQIATINRDAKLSDTAQNHNMQTDRLSVNQQIAHEDRQSKERTVAAEAAIAARKGSGVPV